MKKLLIIGLFVFSLSAQATPVVISDLYVGANDQSSGTPDDVIGDVSKFGINSMTVDLVGTILSIQISSPFAAAGLGTFASYTNTTQGQSKGIGFGDLFLSSTGWAPFGAAPYDNDDNSNGTLWDYAISLGDRWSTSSSASAYELNGATNILNAYISDNFMSGATYRNGQEVAVKTGSSTTTLLQNAATFSNAPGVISFTLDIAGTSLASASSIGLHWGMTCGNDTIEGQYNVPSVAEPATLAIMLAGLALLTVGGLRRKQSRAC